MGELAPTYSKRLLQHDSMPFFLLAPCFTEIFAQACAEIKTWRPTSRFYGFFNFFFLPFIFTFCYLFAAVIDFLLGLLPVQKLLRKHPQDGQFLP